MATLKEGIDHADAISNDQVIFTVTKGQLFLYNPSGEDLLIEDGRSGGISADQIKCVDVPYFKLNYSKWDFVKTADYELSIYAKRQNLDLNALIEGILHKDQTAMKQFFDLRKTADVAAAGLFDYDFQALINLWTDEELMSFVSTLSNTERKEFYNLLLYTANQVNALEYYRLYYPLIAQEIAKNETVQ